MLRKYLFVVLIMAGILLLAAGSSFACSDFQLKAEDGTIVVGRSMEYPVDLHSNAVIVPAGNEFISIDDKGNKGIAWKNKYGFLGIDAFGVPNTYLDGFNEKGLSYGALMFTGAKYQPALEGKFVTVSDLGSWILGNFATVDEVREALKKVNVSGISIKEAGGEVYLHVAVHDASGKSLVIEFIDGKVNVYDNPLGVMTNRPDFPWQINNLRNYINLDANDRNEKTIGGIKIEPTGVGSGMLGLPGDWTPPSRFVRLALCVDQALPVEGADQAVNLAQHILNVVDIPKGLIKENPEPLVRLDGYAQWVVIKDLTNKVLYYKTYENTLLKKVDLKGFDLAPGTGERSIAIDDKQQSVTDVTGQLKLR
ncbi:MAG: choloylglycine hydrolase family protein [Candidatus Omnitrophica bacterium]|nr:choloylglycine hydrolase family protein [Candidatus Omnitrophota bacterium]